MSGIKSAPVSIGIDLGTRGALCAYVNEDGAPEMVANRWGSLSTPSVVGWDGEWKVGEDAVRLALSGSENVWWDVKRRVGTPFQVNLDGRSHSARDLLVPLLSALREDAEAHLETFVSSCVLAVPACFSLTQREAMVRAAQAAGLRETRIVAEPTAAALSFGQEGRFLILDFGAGTVDLSVVESGDGVWQVLESVGSDGIGGYDFDLALADWLRERLLLGPLSSSDPRWRALVMEAERVKIALSECLAFEWTPPPLEGRPQPSLTVQREELERLMRFSIRRLVHIVRRLWERYEPEHLLLVGGSSRIPLLREILEREVARPERLSLCAEDAVVRGAALYTRSGRERLLLDILSGELTAVWEGVPARVIPADSPLPFRSTTELRAGRSGRAALELTQSANELRGEALRLAAIELDVQAGEALHLSCEVSASGRLTAELRRGTGERLAIPLLREEDAPGDAAGEARRRMRELKLTLAAVETALSEEQQDRLHALVLRAEGMPFDAETVDLMEGLVRDLEDAVS